MSLCLVYNIRVVFSTNREQFSMVGKLLLIVFYDNIESFDVHFRRSFSENPDHHIISMVCTLIKHTSRPNQYHLCQKPLSYGKKQIFPKLRPYLTKNATVKPL